MDVVRVGMVGAGFISEIHAHAFDKTSKPRMVIHGVYSRKRPVEFAARHAVPKIYGSLEELLVDKEVDVVDVCVPNVIHKEVCLAAIRAGKDIICEKPLTGAYQDPIDAATGKVKTDFYAHAYRQAVTDADLIVAEAAKHGVLICYAEDFIYAPAITKAKRLLSKSDGLILEMRSEESHSGSHAAYSRFFMQSGGGSLVRLGAHPIGLVLHMKRFEGMLRHNKPIRPESLLCDTANLTHLKAFKQVPNQFLVDSWHDVEDWATLILTFEDGTKATIASNDITLGGVVNTFEAYGTNSIIKCNFSANDTVKAYAPSNDVFGDEYITEKIQTKSGWTYPSPDEDWMRGYPQEMQDFSECIATRREPVSNGELGRDVVQVAYAAYVSANRNQRVVLRDLDEEMGVTHQSKESRV